MMILQAGTGRKGACSAEAEGMAEMPFLRSGPGELGAPGGAPEVGREEAA